MESQLAHLIRRGKNVDDGQDCGDVVGEKRQEMNARMADHAPHPLDVALGCRIRLRRRELGLSQAQLAGQLGITFQQIQKYERGANRVSFSRLVEIARALQCGMTDIVGDLVSSKASDVISRHVARLNEAGAAELLKAYSTIQSSKHRHALLNLTKQLAEGHLARFAD